MHFMFWSSSRARVNSLLQSWGLNIASVSLVSVLALGLPLHAGAQSNPVTATPAPGLLLQAEGSLSSGASAIASASASASAGNAAAGSSANALLVSQFAAEGAAQASGVNARSLSAKDDPPNDAVARFLADKGLLGSVALQVRDKAADLASDLVISAMDFLGVRYKSGGQSRDGGFDCSGFTRHVFERSIGMILPRRASEQANMPGLLRVSENELKPGDLVFFNTLRHTFSHVGIYVGDNKFIHSPRAGGQVRIEDMGQSYWQKRFDGARRVPRLSKQQAELQH
jgi:cell wall-associated NlpC family hydrolase